MKTCPFGTLALAALIAAALPALAETKLKWAHAYEQTEPYHTEAPWAAQDVKKRTQDHLYGHGLRGPRLEDMKGMKLRVPREIADSESRLAPFAL